MFLFYYHFFKLNSSNVFQGEVEGGGGVVHVYVMCVCVNVYVYMYTYVCAYP